MREGRMGEEEKKRKWRKKYSSIKTTKTIIFLKDGVRETGIFVVTRTYAQLF